ncbi:hypothetical protein SAMN02746064_02224 [Alkalibacter saccharofermentans DSM 14828]|uniref:Uncharacterized protein n=1 Tax=Alkalibacter saccharofermentans DSM 14828 TaxID=1120975 RepID=A0A1M5A5D6_9FIRM|nr:hypothetical protein SAMN02746064_02224 [Alkalibacter saccharofermentans DSM 14828]
MRSQVATMYGTKVKGTRYLEMAEGYVTSMGLDENSTFISEDSWLFIARMKEEVYQSKQKVVIKVE